jgi:hypothetical protein
MFAYMTSVVLGDRQVMFNRSFVNSIKLGMHTMNPEALRQAYQLHAGCTDPHDWGMDADAMEKFRPARADMAVS